MRVGDTVPDLEFYRPDGSAVRLSHYRNRPLLLVFLRHLACIACRHHLMQVQQIYPQIQELGGEVLAINFAKPERIRVFAEMSKFPFPVLADPEMNGYQAFTLGRASVLSLLRPRVIGGFIKMIAQGVLPTKPTRGDDLLQLGGDFIIDGQNRLTFAHPTKDPADNPSTGMLMEALSGGK